jgi:glycosyltransferase involved in cell wall biosynthesis
LIPTKNEPLIQKIVNRINKTIKQKHEIIIIDKSYRKPKIRGATVIRQESDGLGNAVVEGLNKAKGNVIAVMDGDGSHDPEDLKKMLRNISKYDIVIGSKLVTGGKTEDSFSRRIVTRVTNSLARLILGINVKDSMTGFIAVKMSVLERIKLRPKGYKFVVEIIYKSKAKVLEVPITFHKREKGKSKVGFNLKGIKEFSRIIILLLELRLGVNR